MRARDAARMDTPQDIPVDIRLMNVTATAAFVVLGLALVLAALWWSVRHPVFALTGITVHGDVRHNNDVTLRANVAPKLSGNFFTVDLARARSVFESVPWIRNAVVRREFPNQLSVELEEHEPVAYWGSESESRLLNSHGEVFVANLDELENTKLPHLSGPDSQSAQVLELYRAIEPRLHALGMHLSGLDLTGRGSWRALLKSGVDIELGRGTVQEVLVRVDRLTSTLAQVASRYGRRVDALESADLRHENGYALRLRGVSTLEPPVKK